MKEILVIGCSNGHGRHNALREVFQKTKSKNYNDETPQLEDRNKIMDDLIAIDNDCRYSNLSMSGAGNTYIKHRLFDFLKKKTPDYVYLQFSGLVRRDVYFLEEATNEFLAVATSSYKIVDGKIYMAGGNGVDPELAEFQKRIFAMSYSKDHNINNYESLQEVFSCLSILEKLNINHNFSFYYDPIKPPNDITKEEGTLTEFPKFINRKNMLPSPLNFAIDFGYPVPDGVHFSDDAFLHYVKLNNFKFSINLNDK